MRGTVPCSRLTLNREIHLELRMTKGKKKFTENFRPRPGDSFQAGQTAKALQGYRVQSLPRGTPAGGLLVGNKNNSIAWRVESGKDGITTDSFLNIC